MSRLCIALLPFFNGSQEPVQLDCPLYVTHALVGLHLATADVRLAGQITTALNVDGRVESELSSLPPLMLVVVMVSCIVRFML